MKTFKEFLAESQINEMYFDKEVMKKLEKGVKNVLNKYGVKATLRPDSYITFFVDIQSSKIDFWDSLVGEWKDWYKDDKYIKVNLTRLEEQWEGKAQKFLLELKDAMMYGDHTNPDIKTKYHINGWNIQVNIGTQKKPYQLIK